jgi:hypothetical protein
LPRTSNQGSEFREAVRAAYALDFSQGLFAHSPQTSRRPALLDLGDPFFRLRDGGAEIVDSLSVGRTLLMDDDGYRV